MKRAVYIIVDQLADEGKGAILEHYSMAAMQRAIAGIVLDRGLFIGTIRRESNNEKPNEPPLRTKLRK